MPGETSPNRIRDDEIYAKRMRGAKLRELAAEYGLDDSRIAIIVRNVSMSMPERDRAELLARSVDWLDDIREKVIELYQKSPAPVTAGAMGMPLTDPDTGEVVRDYTLQRAAIEQMMKLNQIYAKRLGLDAPAETTVRATVKYEIEGINPDDLT